MRTQDLRICDLGPGTLDPRPQDPKPGIYLDGLLFTLPEAAWEKGGGGKFSLNLFTGLSNLLKQTGLHRKQNPRSWAVTSLNWSYIYWTQTFPKNSWSLNRKWLHLPLSRFLKYLGKCFSCCNQQLKWYLTTRTKLIVLFLGERKRNLLRAVASANANTTVDLKQ